MRIWSVNVLLQRQLLCSLLGDLDPNMFYDNIKASVTERVWGREDITQGIEALGLLRDEIVVKNETPLDTLSLYLSKKLAFGKWISIDTLSLYSSKKLICGKLLSQDALSL